MTPEQRRLHEANNEFSRRVHQTVQPFVERMNAELERRKRERQTGEASS